MLPLLPPGDDVLPAVAWTCLPVVTLSAAVSFSPPGAGGGTKERIQTSRSRDAGPLSSVQGTCVGRSGK